MAYLEELFNLKGKVAAVTGAAGQVGRQLCKTFLQLGLKVAGIDKNAGKGPIKGVDYYKLDITKQADVRAVFRGISDKYRRIDILINNAGLGVFEPFEKRSAESFDQVTDVNLKGTFFCIQAYAACARKNGYGGNIVNIASVYGVVSPDTRIYTDCPRNSSEVYGATKAGIIQMTKYFAVHLAKDNIRVNCVSPGGVFNPGSPQGKDFVKNYSYRCPMNRMADVKEIIGGMLYLSSDASTYTTGHNLVIDGGLTCW